jgi:hypothetical protein
MLATSSVVANRRITVVGRFTLRKACSASSIVMPSVCAYAVIQLDRISDLVGPREHGVDGHPVPATDSARPREIASCATLVIP